MKKKPATQIRAYESFIRERDKALEEILVKYQIGIASIVTVLKERTLEIIAHHLLSNRTAHFPKLDRDSIERRLDQWFHLGIEQAFSLITQMRASTYTLSYAGQAEALGQALGKNTIGGLTRDDIMEEMIRGGTGGAEMLGRVELAFHRLLRKVMDAYQLSQVMTSTPEEVLARVAKAFPPKKKISRSLRSKMAKLKEAGKDSAEKAHASSGAIDEAAWKRVLEDYTEDYLPFGRSPNDKVFYPVQLSKDGSIDEVEGYQWELEQELTHDFVQSVRNGEHEAARENGVEDFQWIAIIDNKTDQCCRSRDGLSSREIQELLDDGEEMGDCDVIVPPAHFNCRCRSAPMIEMPEEKPDVDFAGFDSWLEERGRAG